MCAIENALYVYLIIIYNWINFNRWICLSVYVPTVTRHTVSASWVPLQYMSMRLRSYFMQGKKNISIDRLILWIMYIAGVYNKCVMVQALFPNYHSIPTIVARCSFVLFVHRLTFSWVCWTFYFALRTLHRGFKFFVLFAYQQHSSNVAFQRMKRSLLLRIS